MEGLERILEEHPLLHGLDPDFIKLAAGCAKNVRFDAGQYLFHADDPTDWIYLLRHGRVALELAAPGHAAVRFETLGPGEFVGLTWLLPPYHWTYDAHALELVRAIALDATCLRDKCEADHNLGYAVLKRMMSVLIGRLSGLRLQILDVYGQR